MAADSHPEDLPDLPISLADYCRAIEGHGIISIADSDGIIHYVNHRFCEISGYAAAELVGRHHSMVKSGLHGTEFYAEMWGTITAGRSWQGEICNRHKDGSTYWVDTTIVPVPGPDGRPKCYVATRTDVSRQKEQLRQIGRMASEQDDLLRLAPFGIARLRRRRFIRVNEAFSRILGYDEDELLGRSTREIYWSDEQFVELGRLAYEPLTQGAIVNFETELRRKDDGRVWVVAGTCSLDTADPSADALYLIQDLTAHKELESRLASAAELARSAERAKASFLDAMTHELRTPINGILGTGQIIEASLEDPELRSLAAVSNDAARSLLRMVDAVLQFVALECEVLPRETLPVDLPEVAAAALWRHQALADRFGISLGNRLAEGGSTLVIETEPRKFGHLLDLVMDNAVRYNRTGGRVEVDAGRNDSGVWLEVVDTGVGMSEEQLRRLGQPFTRFCLDGDRSGFGLGMALAGRLAGLLAVRIDVESHEGQGTRVRLTLPLARLVSTADLAGMS